MKYHSHFFCGQSVLDKMIQETTCVDRLIDLVSTKVPNEDFDEMVSTVNMFFHGKVPTSYLKTRLLTVLPKYRAQLEELKKIPIVEQRTQEWYDARKTLITASDFAQALGEGKFGTQKQFYQKKSGYETEKFDPYVAPLKWGCMFECVASDIYAKRNNVSVHEFGLLRHPTISYFGASPDGITDHGIMLEIKCPFKRKITGEVPQQYFYQVQGQLDVCGLNECDYLECEFVTEHDDFWGTFDEYPFEQGVIIELPKDTDVVPVYKYSPQDANKTDLKTWTTLNATPGCVVHEWRLKQYNVVRIYRDDEFLKEKLEQLKPVWDNIVRYRADKACYERETMSFATSGSRGKKAQEFEFRFRNMTV